MPPAPPVTMATLPGHPSPPVPGPVPDISGRTGGGRGRLGRTGRWTWIPLGASAAHDRPMVRPARTRGRDRDRSRSNGPCPGVPAGDGADSARWAGPASGRAGAIPHHPPCQPAVYDVGYSVCYVERTPRERPTRPVGPAQRRSQVRPAAAAGIRGPDRRGVAAQRRAGVHDPPAPRAGRAGRVRGPGRRRYPEGLPHHRGRRGGAGHVAAHPARLLLSPAGRARHQGPRRARAAGRRRPRRRAGAPALPGRTHAAVDTAQGGRVPVRPQFRPGRRRRALPARLVDQVAGHGRRPISSEQLRSVDAPASPSVPPPEGPAQGG